ncbi:MAG: ArgP/LysG family DNA-binding transcriptional regulator [Rhodobacteraceae bacterium]|nr:ArgP/LysG family DNA-binding transcriptional regulator [Paracoccaceae bacterium]
MELRDLETLIAISEEGSLEAAARKLLVSAAAVSQRLSRMEELAGKQFVIRSQPAQLTEAGNAMVRAGRQIRLVLEEATPNLPMMALPIQVAVHHDSLASWFVHVLVRFHQRTGRTIEVIASDHSVTRDLMRAGQAAAAVSSDPDPLPGCIAKPLGRLDYVAVVATAHVTGRRWKTLPVLCFDRHDSPTSLSLATLGLTEVSRNYVPSVHDMHAALLHGAGWAVMPLPLVAEGLASGILARLLPDPTLRIELYLHRWRAESSVLGVLEEEAVAAFRSQVNAKYQ